MKLKRGCVYHGIGGLGGVWDIFLLLATKLEEIARQELVQQKTGQQELVNVNWYSWDSRRKIWGVRVRNAGEKSVLIYRTLEMLGGVLWPLIL